MSRRPQPLRPYRLLNTAKTSAATQEISTKSASESPFLKLSPELRNRIYHYALGGRVIHVDGSESFKPTRQSVCGSPCDRSTALQSYRANKAVSSFRSEHASCLRGEARLGVDLAFPLLQSSRLIYEEAALIPFTDNIFLVDVGQDTLKAFMSRLMKSQRSAIRSMQLIAGNWSSSIPDDLQLRSDILASLTSLRHLEVRIETSRDDYRRYAFPKRHLRQYLTAVQKFGKGQLKSADVIVYDRDDGLPIDQKTSDRAEMAEKGLLVTRAELEAREIERKTRKDERKKRKEESDAARISVRALRGLRAL